MKGKIDHLSEELKKLSIKIETKAKEVAEQKLSMFTLEELRAMKNTYREITEEIQDYKNVEKDIERITLDQIKTFIKNSKDQWSKIETKIQRDQFFKETFSKITITDEIIKCFISYDKFASHLTGIDLIIDEIPRNLLMKNGLSKA